MTETKQIPLQLLLNNEGQIEGVPRNPRQITEEAFDKLKKSLEESDLTDFKPLIVYPYGEQFVVLGGNMRLRALNELGVPDVSCIVVPEGTPVAYLKKIVILDNNEFGEYDWDAIANEWSDEPLQDWGLETPKVFEEPVNLDAEEYEKPFVCKITFENEKLLQDFMQMYSEELKTSYNCTFSISGGKL